MEQISESELKRIITQVVNRTMGITEPAIAASTQAFSPSAPSETKSIPAKDAQPGKKTVAIGSDHGGYDLKEILKKDLAEMGYEVVDFGTNNKEACDYPDFAQKVAESVGSGKTAYGVMIDGAGIGSCMAANKVPGVRAAMCYDYSTAVNSKEHNDANLLTLGAGLIGVNLARQILKTWLSTDFGGGRHAGRVNKIIAIEKQYTKG